jgi:hypothetical protein
MMSVDANLSPDVNLSLSCENKITVLLHQHDVNLSLSCENKITILLHQHDVNLSLSCENKIIVLLHQHDVNLSLSCENKITVLLHQHVLLKCTSTWRESESIMWKQDNCPATSTWLFYCTKSMTWIMWHFIFTINSLKFEFDIKYFYFKQWSPQQRSWEIVLELVKEARELLKYVCTKLWKRQSCFRWFSVDFT